MQAFYMIIGRDALYLYEKDDTRYNRQYIEGNPEFHYQINNVKNDIEKLLAALVEKYNLDGKSELSFVVLENSDLAVTKAVRNALDRYISNTHDLNAFMLEIINRMNMDEVPLVKEFGVNYEGVNYRLINGMLWADDYSLLGYTLQVDDLMSCIG